MPFQEIQLKIPEDSADLAGDMLNELGALAVSFHDAGDQPLYEPEIGTTPFWQQTKVHGLFPSDIDIQPIINQIQYQLSSIKPLTLEVVNVPDKDWQKECQDNFKAICINDRLWICPSWDQVKTDINNATVIHLDPGLAFGTGSHATTRLCLEWLTQQIASPDLVIDYGCGSGILGIAAIKLGAKQVWSVDIDPQALEATRENAVKNNIPIEQIHTVLPELLPSLQADVLVANILALPLIELASLFANLVKPGGDIVLSGILNEQCEMIITAYANYFDLNEPTTLDEWICLSGKRKLAR